MKIRYIQATDDLNQISKIYVRSWQQAYQGIVPAAYLARLSEEGWAEWLAQKEFPAYVLLDRENYVGTAACGPARDKTMAGWGELISLYLLPEYSGKGWGKKLLNYVLKELEAMGFADSYLWVLEENLSACKFYEGQGFEYSGDTQQIIIAGKTLTELRYIRRQ